MASGKSRLPAASRRNSSRSSRERRLTVRSCCRAASGCFIPIAPQGRTPRDRAQIVAQSLRTGERNSIIEGGRDGRYVSTGHLLYGLNGTLLAVPFDVRQRSVRGAAVPVVEGVMDADVRTGALHYSVSQGGSLTYLTGASSLSRTLIWAGQKDGHSDPLPADALSYGAPRVSPDGMRVAVNVQRSRRRCRAHL